MRQYNLALGLRVLRYAGFTREDVRKMDRPRRAFAMALAVMNIELQSE